MKFSKTKTYSLVSIKMKNICKKFFWENLVQVWFASMFMQWASDSSFPYGTQLQHSFMALNYCIQLRHSITALNYGTQLWFNTGYRIRDTGYRKTVNISSNQHYCVASSPSSAGACFFVYEKTLSSMSDVLVMIFLNKWRRTQSY